MAKKRKQSPKRKTKKRKAPKKRGSKKKPGTTRKDGTANSGLKKQYFSRVKQEFHDIDYADQLSDKDKAWLSAFTDEDLGGRFNHPGKRIYRKKKDRLAAFNRNNARNRDIYGINKAAGKTVDIPTDSAFQYWEENYTDIDFEERMVNRVSDDEDQYLTEKEFLKLLKRKVEILPEIKTFYMKRYGLEESLEDAKFMKANDNSTDDT